jgi:hypothetical protein
MTAEPIDLSSHSPHISQSPSTDGGDWPVLSPAALQGIAGRIVEELDPHTEADPVAILLTLLTVFGAAIGMGPHASADGSEHPGRIFLVLVGDTAKARKGTSLAHIRALFLVADPEFIKTRVLSGFGSGESLVDAIAESADKRALVVEPEWVRILAVTRREGSTLSALIREAWDGGTLTVRTRGSGVVSADGAHVAVLGHVTGTELRAKLADTEVANGFANRHLFALVRRSKRLPHGGKLEADAVRRLGIELRDILHSARKVGLLGRTDAAEKRWAEIYDRMADDEPGGLLESIIARDSPQVLRLSVIYALLDKSSVIDVEHVEAAFGVITRTCGCTL